VSCVEPSCWHALDRVTIFSPEPHPIWWTPQNERECSRRLPLIPTSRCASIGGIAAKHWAALVAGRLLLAAVVARGPQPISRTPAALNQHVPLLVAVVNFVAVRTSLPSLVHAAGVIAMALDLPPVVPTVWSGHRRPLAEAAHLEVRTWEPGRRGTGSPPIPQP